jgi:hypothetical protein
MNKLKSRKLWCAVVSAALGVAALFIAPELMENIERLLVVLSPILLYILCQSIVDCCATIKDKKPYGTSNACVQAMDETMHKETTNLKIVDRIKDITPEMRAELRDGCGRGGGVI